MRGESEIRMRLTEARQALQDTTLRLSQGNLAGLDVSGIATLVAVVRALEWVLGEGEELPFSVSPLHRPIDEV
jgi:hypothetical protein